MRALRTSSQHPDLSIFQKNIDSNTGRGKYDKFAKQNGYSRMKGETKSADESKKENPS